MCRVEIEGESTLLFSPYSKKLIDACKRIGGRWSKWHGAWEFQKNQEESVINLALDFFGECNGIKKDDYIGKRERLIKEKSVILNRLEEIEKYLAVTEIPDELQDKD